MEEQRSSKKSALIIVLVLVAIVILGVIGYNALKSSSLPKSNMDVVESQSDAPTLADLNCVIYDEAENALELSGIANGKPLIINFWTTWCPHCVEEMTGFQEAFDAYGDRISFAMVDCVDGNRETIDAGSTYIKENGFTFPVYYDVDQSAVVNFGVAGIPSTVVFDSNGSLVLARAGELERDQLFALVEGLVN